MAVVTEVSKALFPQSYAVNNLVRVDLCLQLLRFLPWKSMAQSPYQFIPAAAPKHRDKLTG